jgi:hypothetical protein
MQAEQQAAFLPLSKLSSRKGAGDLQATTFHLWAQKQEDLYVCSSSAAKLIFCIVY